MVYFGDFLEVWSGVRSIQQGVGGSKTNQVYVDGRKVSLLTIGGEFSAKINALSFPEDLLDRDFDLSFRSYHDDSEKTYDIHVVYACSATLTTVNRSTVTTNVEPVSFVLDILSSPSTNEELRTLPTAHLIINSSALPEEALLALEHLLYSTNDGKLPTASEISELLESFASLKIVYHGDGTWTAIELKPINAINMLSSDMFVIDWHTSRYLDEDTYKIHSG